MKKTFFAFLAATCILSSCNDSAKKQTTPPEQNNKKENTVQVLNNISVETEGDVEVYRAFLSFEDGSLVPSSNKTAAGKPIFLNLNITKGWTEENGQVSLGAYQKISTDNGTVILEAPDLFSNVNAIKADDAKFIRLDAVINEISIPIEYFVVDYKVWDKKGNGVIKGSYKFYVD
jgi:hypothetical protein